MIFEIQRNRQQAQFPSYMKSIQENCSFHLSRTTQLVTVSLIKVSDIFAFIASLEHCKAIVDTCGLSDNDQKDKETRCDQ